MAKVAKIFRPKLEKKVLRSVEGIRLPFLDLHSLDKNKKATGRPQDLADLKNLPKSD